jgi:carboxypeptidase C (cathepsin A)
MNSSVSPQGIAHRPVADYSQLGHRGKVELKVSIAAMTDLCLNRRPITPTKGKLMSTENGDKENNRDEAKSKTPEPLSDDISQTSHSITVNGRSLNYTATAGRIILKTEDEKEGEKAKAAIFFVAYTLDRPADATEAQHAAARPITFSFNGGPGSSSVWLHLGVLGPRRVLLERDGQALPPPYALVDNEFSLLDKTDLVFIDPVTTGFSRAVPGEKDKQFHGFKPDIESVGDFIRLYVSRYHRWASPRYLIGESYGTTRAAGLSGYLQERHGLYLNGIMLVSVVLNFMTLDFAPGNDLPYILFLPTYAATARYHNRLAPELQADLSRALAEVEAFALGEYATALLQGDALPAEARAAIAARLSRYIGLPADYIERTNLRINIHRFVKELLRDRRRTVGRLDSRYTGIDRDAAGENNEYDPSYAIIQGPYTGALNDYVRRELRFESDLPYEILSERVRPWSFDQHQNAYVNVGETLRKAMSMNPHLRVFVANGYYDLATPYLATRYTFDHLELDDSLRDNITMTYYEAGHMMYIHDPSLTRLKADLDAFLDGDQYSAGQ